MQDKNSIHIFGESRLDFKYKKFLGEELCDSYELVAFIEVLRLIFRPLKKDVRYYFHIRYLKWRGRLLSLPYYIMVVMLCRLRGITIVYTCHNFWEHNFKSKSVNRGIRKLLIRSSHRIIVLDEKIRSIIDDETPGSLNKIEVVHFSDFSEYFENQKQENQDFQEKYNAWLTENSISFPDVILVSGSYRSLSKFDYILNGTKSNVLCIVPNVEKGELDKRPSNVFVYNDFVRKEISSLLKSPGIIGMVGLDNGSVATSLYMFASYNIPSLVLDHSPMNDLVNKYQLGLLYDLNQPIDSSIKKIQQSYSVYAKGCERLLNDHTWEKSNDIHRQIFSL